MPENWAFAACVVEPRAEIKLTLIAGQPLAAGRIDGKPVIFLIDTGAQKTLLSETAVRRLDLPRDEWVSSRMRGVGGYERHRNARMGTLELGGMVLRRRGTESEASIAVVPLASFAVPGPVIDGLLGLDYLSNFDIAFDLRRGRMTLYGVHGCAGSFLPWSDPYTAIRARSPVPGRLLLPARLDGRDTMALIDSGSTRSIVSLPAALRAGITQATLDQDWRQPVRGVGATAVMAYEHRFSELRIGADELSEMPVLVMPLPPSGAGVVLGIDWLGARRVWLSWATRQVFVGQ